MELIKTYFKGIFALFVLNAIIASSIFCLTLVQKVKVRQI